MTFSLDISKFNDKVKSLGDVAVRKICLELTSSVVLKTPVDTGRARGNWFGTVNTPSNETSTKTDKNGASTIGEAQAAIKAAPGQIYYLSNNLPYIRRLEYGYSKQAPKGMVRITITEIKRHYS